MSSQMTNWNAVEVFEGEETIATIYLSDDELEAAKHIDFIDLQGLDDLVDAVGKDVVAMLVGHVDKDEGGW